MTKTPSYRINNWSDDNKALVKRGSLNIWFSEEAIQSSQEETLTGQRGRPSVYSDEAILCALLLKSRLPSSPSCTKRVSMVTDVLTQPESTDSLLYADL